MTNHTLLIVVAGVSLFAWLICMFWGINRTYFGNEPSKSRNALVAMVWGIVNWVLFMVITV